MKAEWKHCGYSSQYGSVYLNEENEWVGTVIMPSGKLGKIKETFVSAEVAKGAVERTWKREHKSND